MDSSIAYKTQLTLNCISKDAYGNCSFAIQNYTGDYNLNDVSTSISIAVLILHTLADSSTLTITSDMNFTKISVACHSDAAGTVDITSDSSISEIDPLGISLAANESWSWDTGGNLLDGITIENNSGIDILISLG